MKMKIIWLIAFGITISGCSNYRGGKEIGDNILQHCQSYQNKIEIDRCFTDSEFVLDQLE